MTVGPGHTAAAHVNVFQLRAKACEDIRPLPGRSGKRRHLSTVTKQIPRLAALILRCGFRQRLRQPFMHQHHAKIAALVAQHLVVFIAIAEHQRRIDTHHRHAELGHAVKEVGSFLRGARESRQEALNMLRLAVGRERQQHRLVSYFLDQANKVGNHLRIVIAGEGILNHQHPLRPLLRTQRFQLFQGGIRRTVADHLLLQRWDGKQRKINHTNMLF